MQEKFFQKKIIITILLIFIIILIIFCLYQNKKIPIIEKEHVEDYLLSVFINNNELSIDEPNLILSRNLKPTFLFKYKDLSKIKSVFINEIDIFSDTFFIETNTIRTEKGSILFSPPFLFKPGDHDIKVSIEKDDNTIVQKNFSFNLSLFNEFSKKIDESEILFIPKTTKKRYEKSWFVQGGKLKINPFEGGSHASLAFLYPFVDIQLSFELKPYGEKINLVFYFLDSGRSIVIGNGNNYRSTLLRGDPNPNLAIEGKRFEMVPEKTYSVFIGRQKNNYKLYISEGTLEKVTEKLDKKSLILEFKDPTRKTYTEDYIGFSVWAGSNGLEIDNLTLSTVETHAP